jgi:hypothetical protein
VIALKRRSKTLSASRIITLAGVVRAVFREVNPLPSHPISPVISTFDGVAGIPRR